MANVRDFIPSGDKSTISIAYLLLIANVLGLTIFLDDKNKDVKISENQAEKSLQQKPASLEKTSIEKKLEGGDKTVFQKTAEKKMGKKSISTLKEKDETLQKEEKEIKKIEQSKHEKVNTQDRQTLASEDNVISFEQAVSLKPHENKRLPKRLVWHFPES